MNAKDIRDLLIKAKVCYTQKKNIECVGAIIMALRNMGDGAQPVEVCSALREVVLLVGKEEMVTEVLGHPLTYTSGQEKELLVPFAKVFKIAMENKDAESHEVALARKIKIDKAFNEGKSLLARNNVSEADQVFSEAITFYRDEHTLFSLIGEALMQANAPKRAFPYLKRGIEVDPNNKHMRSLYDKCEELRKQAR